VELRATDAAVIALSASFWSIINATLAPIFWQLTRLPILCDILAMISLIVALWWARKPGTAALVGLLATSLNFILRPGAVHFLGFTAASIVYDLLARAIGYSRCFSARYGPAFIPAVGVVSTWIAGLIIGAFFMGGSVPVLYFSALHAAGGLIGSIFGVAIVKSLERRGVKPRSA